MSKEKQILEPELWPANATSTKYNRLRSTLHHIFHTMFLGCSYFGAQRSDRENLDMSGVLFLLLIRI
jgi:VanZ family protein